MNFRELQTSEVQELCKKGRTSLKAQEILQEIKNILQATSQEVHETVQKVQEIMQDDQGTSQKV